MGVARAERPEQVADQQVADRRLYIGVVGSGHADEEECSVAEEVGVRLADAGAVLVCGGLSGVMEAACRGARGRGGITVGILPGSERSDANAFVDVIIATGLGEARNAIVAASSDALIAVGGAFGTLSEIAFALRAGKAVVGIGSWELARQGMAVEGVVPARRAAEAVSLAMRLARDRIRSR